MLKKARHFSYLKVNNKILKKFKPNNKGSFLLILRGNLKVVKYYNNIKLNIKLSLKKGI